jgi:acyl-CoA hydrolase
VSINNTTQIDLQGQVASESDGHRHISGTGGQLQFVRGAYASKGWSRSSVFRQLIGSVGSAAAASCLI